MKIGLETNTVKKSLPVYRALRETKAGITRYIKKSEWVFALFASLSAFATYSCMYAFRKPYTLCIFEGLWFWGILYKVWLITAQVIGYTLSSWICFYYCTENNSGEM